MAKKKKRPSRATNPRGRKGPKKPSKRKKVKEITQSNQHISDPRQALFISYYLNPDSETFSNFYQSALRAGYSEGHAKKMGSVMPDWLKEKQEQIKDDEMIELAEKNLKEGMEVDYMQPVISAFGFIKDEKGNLVKKVNTALFRERQATSKFVAERLNKEKYGQAKIKVNENENDGTRSIIIDI